MHKPNNQHDSQGIWIPRAIWLASDLSLREKALLAELGSHKPTEQYRASNQQLIELLDIGERQVRACLSALREKGFITIRFNAQHERIIRVTGKHARPSKRRIQPTGGKRPRPKAAHDRKMDSANSS